MSAESVQDAIGFNNKPGVDIPMDDPMRAGVHTLWEQDLFMDFKINIGDQEFHVHKVIMASMSDYFRAMLSGGMAEGEQDYVVVEGVSAGVMKILIRYIYTNHMDISEDNAAEVLGGAVYFQMKSAIKICTRFMVDKLDSENWFDVLTLFGSYGQTDAVKEVRTYAKRNITDIAKADNATLPYEEFYFVVENWQSREYELFSFILNWVEAEKEERDQYADKLLCSVRFSLMTPRELNEMQNMKNYSGTPNSWDTLIEKALEYHKLPLHQRVLEDSDQSKVRSAPSFVDFSRDRAESAGYFLEPLREECFLEHQGLKIPYEYGRPFLQIVVNNFLIVCTFYGKFYIFDPRSLQWEQITYIDRSMAGAVLAHDNKHLYVIGGFQSDIVQDSIVQYNFETNEWSEFDTLPVHLRYFAACVLENGLYISGGVPGERIPPGGDWSNVNYDDTVDTMYRLDLTSHEWETKAPMWDSDYIHQMHSMRFCGKDVISIIQEDYDMSVYLPEAPFHWGGIDFTFNEPPLSFRNHWTCGNSIFMLESDSQKSDVASCQVLTFPEFDSETVVENYGGYPLRNYPTVLAIAPYTSEPGFGLQ